MSAHTIKTVPIKANGLTFEVDVCGGGPKLALLLHGFPESKFSWRFQMPLLAELGYTVWAPNLRGYGRTSRPKSVNAYRMEHLRADVAGLIDEAQAQGITGGVLLMGHDWGGSIAWSFALAETRPVERLIIMNSPHPTLFAKGRETWPQKKRSWYMSFYRLPWLPEKLLTFNKAALIGEMFRQRAVDKTRFPDRVRDHYRKNALIRGAITAMLNYYRALPRKLSAASAARLATPPLLKTPTLMIWGEEDHALGKELTYGTANLVKNFTMSYLPQVSHWVQQEAPEACNTIISAWIEGKPIPMAGMRGQLLYPDLNTPIRIAS